MSIESTTELTRLSAAESLRRFQRRDLSPVEVMNAIITLAEATESHVRAFSETFFEQALDAARQAEARYGSKGAQPRALEGLAIGIKEVTPVAGQRTTNGSLAYRQAPLEKESAPLVARILQAGGIIHARTTSPEFTCVPFTHSRLWGVTRNPWNLEFSPGGSSGGAAVALALGTAALANGTDIGGSIRMPAAFCGVVGLKPSYGRVPATAPWNLDHYSHEGPLARTVGDCALLENVISGPHSADPASLRPKVPIPDSLGDVTGARIGLSVDLDGYVVDRDVARNTEDTADTLREAGATVEKVQLGWELAEIIEAARVHYGFIFAAYVQREMDAHPDALSDYAIAFANRGTSVSRADVLAGLEKEAKIFASLATVLERYDALICPTLSVDGYVAGDSYLDHGPMVNGVEVPDILETMMTVPFNICSRCPVLNVPSGTAACGVRTGVQIVGRPYDDVSVFEVGAAIERIRPWDQLRPDVSFAQ